MAKLNFLFILLVTLLSLVAAQEGVTETEVTADGNVVVEEPVVPVEESTMPEGEQVIEEAVVAEEVSMEEVPMAVEEPAAVEDDPKCPDRDHLMRCAGEYLDTNKNRLLERSELQSAIDLLPFWARGILSILGSVDKMMTKCDVDGDDAISIDYDMQNNKETCLATCFKRRAFKSAFFPDCNL